VEHEKLEVLAQLAVVAGAGLLLRLLGAGRLLLLRLLVHDLPARVGGDGGLVVG
jgi:hypothetical protein